MTCFQTKSAAGYHLKEHIIDYKIYTPDQQVTEVCKQQERHFSNVVKDLEHKLNETIRGRDELLTLRYPSTMNITIFQRHIKKEISRYIFKSFDSDNRNL